MGQEDVQGVQGVQNNECFGLNIFFGAEAVGKTRFSSDDMLGLSCKHVTLEARKPGFYPFTDKLLEGNSINSFKLYLDFTSQLYVIMLVRALLNKMKTQSNQVKIVEAKVTYNLLKDDKFFIFEDVPARVNVETGEQLFSPETVERLQKIIWDEKEPSRQIVTPVYQFA